jgi:hypothetical protein
MGGDVRQMLSVSGALSGEEASARGEMQQRRSAPRASGPEKVSAPTRKADAAAIIFDGRPQPRKKDERRQPNLRKWEIDLL